MRYFGGRGWLGLLVGVFALSGLVGGVRGADAQDLPADEFQVNFNTYFDNFRVNIVYPSATLTKQIGPSTSLTGRYLVDIISAASMKSLFKVDGVSSASSRSHGGGEGFVDEVRNEFGIGLTQLVSRATVSVNGLYSTEHDYTSRTVAGSISVPFAKKNTVLQFGAVHSWDVVSPQTRDWNADKRVLTLNAGLTQVLTKSTVFQIDGSYSDMSGFLSDAYQVVTIINNGTITTYDPVNPDQRTRRAIGVRINQSLSGRSALNLGYRYYWDNWDVTSNTANIKYTRRLADGVTGNVGVRAYLQGKAFFFEPSYAAPMTFMTVDSKLNKGYSWELLLGTTISGDAIARIPSLAEFASDKFDITLDMNIYMRHTDTPDWHSKLSNLFAYMFSVGYRYRF